MVAEADYGKMKVIVYVKKAFQNRLAFPLAWWAMDQWLQGYAYRISVGINVFLITGVFVILITLFIISFQAIKAAIANPVKSLSSE